MSLLPPSSLPSSLAHSRRPRNVTSSRDTHGTTSGRRPSTSRETRPSATRVGATAPPPYAPGAPRPRVSTLLSRGRGCSSPFPRRVAAPGAAPRPRPRPPRGASPPVSRTPKGRPRPPTRRGEGSARGERASEATSSAGAATASRPASRRLRARGRGRGPHPTGPPAGCHRRRHRRRRRRRRRRGSTRGRRRRSLSAPCQCELSRSPVERRPRGEGGREPLRAAEAALDRRGARGPLAAARRMTLRLRHGPVGENFPAGVECARRTTDSEALGERVRGATSPPRRSPPCEVAVGLSIAANSGRPLLREMCTRGKTNMFTYHNQKKNPLFLLGRIVPIPELV